MCHYLMLCISMRLPLVIWLIKLIFKFSNACVVAALLRSLLATRGKVGCVAAIGLVGLRVGQTILRATNGMCVVGDESVSYHARALVT